MFKPKKKREKKGKRFTGQHGVLVLKVLFRNKHQSHVTHANEFGELKGDFINSPPIVIKIDHD